MRLVVEVEVSEEDVRVLKERYECDSNEDVVDLLEEWLSNDIEVRVD